RGELRLPSSTISGASLVTNGGTLTLSGTKTHTFPIHNAGTMSVSGTITLNGALTTASGSSLTLNSSASPTQVGRLTSTGTLSLGTSADLTLPSGALTLPAGSTCTVGASATLTCATGLANAGTLQTSGGSSSTVTVTAGTLTNTGAINCAAGHLFLAAQLDNQGTITTGFQLHLNKAAATHTNTGTLTINAPSNPCQVAGGPFTPDGGPLAGTGTLAIAAGGTLGGTNVVTQVTTTLTGAHASCASLTNAAGKSLTLTGPMTLATPIHNAGTM